MRWVPWLLIASLALVLLGQWFLVPVAAPGLQVRQGEPSNAGAAAALPGGLDIPALGEEVTFELIDQRPIFVWDRKPVERDGPALPPAPEATGLETLDFTGVVITPKGPLALVKDNKTGQMKRLTPGETLEGWTAKLIEPEGLTLVAGAREERLPLREFKKVILPPAPPPMSGGMAAPGMPQLPGGPQMPGAPPLPGGPQMPGAAPAPGMPEAEAGVAQDPTGMPRRPRQSGRRAPRAPVDQPRP